MAEGDVGDGEAALPEQDDLVVALASRLRSGDDFAELGMQRVAAEPAGIDVEPERAGGADLRARPIIDHNLVGDIDDRQLERALRAEGDEAGAALDPLRL